MSETSTVETDQPDQPDTEQPDAEQQPEQPEAEQQPDGAAPTQGIEPSSEVALFQTGGQGLLTVDPHQRKWTPTQRIALTAIGIQTVGEDAVPPGFVAQFLHVCQSADLDPWRREAYLISYGRRYVKGSGEVVDNRKHSLVIGIDGFRKKAEDTSEYVGQVGPEWLHPDKGWLDYWISKWGNPEAARVGVLRRGFDAPVYGVAMFEEFCPMVDEWGADPAGGNRRVKTGRKTPTDMWIKMPASQSAKCAEAQAFRKAFPRTFTGMYGMEEMARARAEHAESEREFAAARRRDAMRASGAQSIAPTQGAASADEAPQPDVAEQSTAEPVAAAEVVGEVVEQASEETLALLRAEFEFQADVLGRTPETLARRRIQTLRKNLADFTVDDMRTLVEPHREPTLAAMRRDDLPNADAYAAAYDAATDKGEPVDVSAFADAEDPDPDDPHVYVATESGDCWKCGLPEAVGPHPETSNETGSETSDGGKA